jgi:hypothetical protein
LTDTLLVWQSGSTMKNKGTSERNGDGFWIDGVWYPAEVTVSFNPDEYARQLVEQATGHSTISDKTLTFSKRCGVSGSELASLLTEPCILIAQIIDRLLALPYWRDNDTTPPPRDELVATLTTAHHDCPRVCDLARIMELDDAGLRHDVLGFYRYTDVESGEFNECGPFWPLSTERL